MTEGRIRLQAQWAHYFGAPEPEPPIDPRALRRNVSESFSLATNSGSCRLRSSSGTGTDLAVAGAETATGGNFHRRNSPDPPIRALLGRPAQMA
jgi:hypothetical protein